MKLKKIIIWIVVWIVVIMCFFCLTQPGIDFMYTISGGSPPTEQETTEQKLSIILSSYEEQIRTYELYKNDDNPTAQKWAQNAKEKANALADEYNELANEFILNGLGE